MSADTREPATRAEGSHQSNVARLRARLQTVVELHSVEPGIAVDPITGQPRGAPVEREAPGALGSSDPTPPLPRAGSSAGFERFRANLNPFPFPF